MWYFVGGWFDGIESRNPSYWTWSMIWVWIAAFPWIPALYTGVFSTGLCLWIEVFFLIYLIIFFKKKNKYVSSIWRCFQPVSFLTSFVAQKRKGEIYFVQVYAKAEML